jgi:5'-deoxynucleotidase YfbR-like HD superfamily hydrolase
MLSGRRLDLIDPSPLDIEITDIAHGLARVARWNGQTRGEHAFSVAQHSVLVEEVCAWLEPGLGPAERLTALLHDAPEFVIGDMISPFKNALGLDYRRFEERLEAAIHMRFGLPARVPASLKRLIKQADRTVAWFEATELAGFTHAESDAFFAPPPRGLAIDVRPQPAAEAQHHFLARFDRLMPDGDGARDGRNRGPP